MTGARTTGRFFPHAFVYIAIAIVAGLASSPPAIAEVVIFDGFGDADRDNDGVIEFYDTDLNDSGTWNDFTVMGDPPVYSGPDAGLASRGITEVTAATDPNDVGVIWSGIRSFDSAANLVKSKLRIINDSAAVGVETSTSIHNSGLALGVESRGGGSSFIGRFPQSIDLGPNEGDKIIASVDWRVWREANDNTSQPLASNALRWGLYEDTDNEFGQTAGYGDGWFNNGGGQNGATVMWGRDDGKWFDSSPGAEGDKGINTELPFGSFAPTTNARIRWETNVLNINGGTNNARILEGNGAIDTIGGGGGDTATVANPSNPEDGPGGIITDLSSFVPHTLKLEIVRLADGLVEVASIVDNVEFLRDSIKTTDTGYNVLQPIPFSYDYVAFRNATNDWDYVIDNFKVEVFNSDAGLDGDFNGDGSVDAADWVYLQKNGNPPQDFALWEQHFGESSGPGGSGSNGVPEPATITLLMICGLLAAGNRFRAKEARARRV